MARNESTHKDGRHGACPRGATIVGLAVNRRFTGTSPVAAITSRGHGSGCQSPVHRDKPGGAAVLPLRAL